MVTRDCFRIEFYLSALLIFLQACSYPAPFIAGPEDVRADDTGIDIVMGTNRLREGDTLQAECYVLHRDGTRSLVETGTAWSAGDPLVLDAGPSGLIRALTPGTADIIAEAQGFTASRRVSVEGIIDYTGLVISEVYYDPKDDEDEEFIELKNGSSVDMNLSGLGVVDGGSNSKMFIIPAETIVPAGGFLVIARTPGVFAGKFGNPPDLGGYSFTLTNDGEAVFIKLNDGTLLDSAYLEGGTAAFPAPENWCGTKHPSSPDGQSVHRISLEDTDTCADWSAGTPTPGY